MGTNFYLKKKLSSNLKEQVKEFLDNDDYESVKDILDSVEPIHIGKRSYGWKFLWDVNNFNYYRPVEKEVYEWLKNSGEIVDEYGNKYDFEDFIQSIPFDGCDIEEYYKEHPTVCHFTYSGSDIARFIRNCGISDIPYINSYGEFYIGKLRCTIANDFG